LSTAEAHPVVVNARAAIRAEIGGVERVARELAAGLSALRPDRYRVARPRPALAHRAGHAWEQTALPLLARRARLIYSPANLAPLAAGRRNVVVIHDAAALRHPEWYGRGYVAYQRALLPALARRSALTITISEWSKRELVDVLGADPERVAVVPNGVDERFTPDATTALELDRPYVLAVGSRIARKNLAALQTAAAQLAAEGIDLVAAGSGRHYMRAEGGTPVRALGYVDDADLPGLYAGALALAMPSLYEGFGLPVLEAMAAGTPVVAADRGALPETSGGAALLVDPDDPDALAAELLRVVGDTELATNLRERGLARAASFSWRTASERTDALIGSLLDTPR
jgi:glycosyltransferase involved in cell wall biosynthesis